MKIFVFDTNSIILFLKGNKKVADVFDKAKDFKILPIISIITKIELLAFPKLTKQEEKIIKAVLDEFQIEGLTDEISEQTIKIRQKYKLKIPDAIIAATAIINKADLITRDIRHFKKIKCLKIIDPLKIS